MWQRYVRPFVGVLLIGGMLTALGCADKPTVPQYQGEALAVQIVAGPDTTSAVAHGSKVTFKWQPIGGSGNYTFKYQIDGGAMVDIPRGQTSVIIADTSVLTPNSAPSPTHEFKVEVSDGVTTASTTRAFKIAPRGSKDTAPPTITLTFPPPGYKVAPNSPVRFEWEVSDLSNGTSPLAKAGVKRTGWGINGMSGSTWWLSPDIPLSGYADYLPVGWNYIYIQAEDLAGNVTIYRDSVEVIHPTILFVNEAVLEPGYSGDTPPLSEANEFRRSRYFWGSVFDGFSVAEWNVAEKDYPTTDDIPSTVTTIVWVGSGDFQNSSWGWNIGWEYTYSVATGGGPAPNVLTDFIDAGGKVWITGENWLEEINVGVDNPWPEGLENVYLGMDTLSASFGGQEVVYDFAAVQAGWPALSTDIAKLGAGIGDYGDWTCDFTEYLTPGVVPLYRVSGIDVEGTSLPPADEDGNPITDWYAAWYVPDANGDPQVVFMGFDIYYFSAADGKVVGQKILGELLGN